MTNRSGISGGLSNLNVILSPDLSKTTMFGSSVTIITIIMTYILINCNILLDFMTNRFAPTEY